MGLSVHEQFKYPSIKRTPSVDARSPEFAEIDGFRNFFGSIATLVSDGLGQAKLEMGINAMAAVGASEPLDARRPCRLCSASTRMLFAKLATSSTPCHDSFDMDGGLRAPYFGDAKVQHMPNPDRRLLSNEDAAGTIRTCTRRPRATQAAASSTSAVLRCARKWRRRVQEVSD